MFTDRFIELPIKVFNTKEEELTGKAEYFDGFLKVLPGEISNYKPSTDIELDIADIVHVTLKNGHTFNVYMDLIEFESALNNHSHYAV